MERVRRQQRMTGGEGCSKPAEVREEGEFKKSVVRQCFYCEGDGVTS